MAGRSGVYHLSINGSAVVVEMIHQVSGLITALLGEAEVGMYQSRQGAQSCGGRFSITIDCFVEALRHEQLSRLTHFHTPNRSMTGAVSF